MQFLQESLRTRYRSCFSSDSRRALLWEKGYLTLESTPRFKLQAMRVKELAEAAGVTGDTIRYYEKAGLLPPAPRIGSGYRDYDLSSVERVRFIKGGQSFGLSLSDLKELLEIRDNGSCPCGHTDEILKRRAQQLEEEVASLKMLQDQLHEMMRSRKDGEYEWCCTNQRRT